MEKSRQVGIAVFGAATAGYAFVLLALCVNVSLGPN